MKKPFRGLQVNRLSTKIIFMVGAVLLLSSSVFCAVSIINSRIGIKKSIQQRMLDIANCAAGSLNGDVLETLTVENQGSPEYWAVYNALAVFRDNVELEFVYGIKDEGNGRFTFTVDPALHDASPFGAEVKYTEALAAASRGTAAVDEIPYTDEWGTFYSAYSPVYNSSGKVVGIIAADFSKTWFEAQLSEQTRSTIISYTVILLVTILIAAILSLIIVRPFGRRQEQLSLEVERKADENKELSLQIVRSLADAIDAKDQFTRGHSARVSQYAAALAEVLGWEKEKINSLRYSALLHDIGKIGVPDSILNSPRRLNGVEYDMIKSHTDIGGDILKNKIMIGMAEDVARSHHERYDGKGYPRGLKENEISEAARIVTIADAFDAMNSNRVYRKALEPAYIRKELTGGRGTQFDPNFVDKFIELWDQGKLDGVIKSDAEEESGMAASSALLQEVMEKFVAQGAADDIDSVSGVMSRTAGEAAIVRAMKNVGGCFAFIDLDNLKKINDTYGHEAGDLALRTVGGALAKNSENRLCCRLGGDEFLCFMKDVTREEAEKEIQKIIADFDEQKNEGPETAMASLSVGLAMCAPAEQYIKAYNRADKALYHVKQNGKNGYNFYNPEVESSKYERVDVNRLVAGIRNSGGYKGAMDVEYRHFAALYEFVENIKTRFSHPFRLIMITLETGEEEPRPEELEKAMYFMEQSIRQTIRNVDVITRYSRQQFLVILLGSSKEGAQIAVDRIFRGYYKMNGSGAFSPSYAIAEMEE